MTVQTSAARIGALVPLILSAVLLAACGGSGDSVMALPTTKTAPDAALQTNADGSVTPAKPLPTNAVALSRSPALTFEKITAWKNELNRCFELSSLARAADVDCADADGTRLIALDFKENSKDLAEAYRVLYSESDRSAVQGSTLSNPAILVNIPASGSPPEPQETVVEFTVDQPRTGPLAGSQTAPIRYTITMTFVRTASGRAKAGNWILAGNQKRYDASLQPGYEYAFQMNASLRNLLPDYSASLLDIRISPSIFNPTTRTYASANIRAARVKGPGLPDAGLVFSPSAAPGASRFLTPDNKTGLVSSGLMSNPSTRPIFYLAFEKTSTSQSTTIDANSAYFRSAKPSFAAVPQTDFSAIQAFSRYKVEYFLNSNSTGEPDLIETTRILAPLMPPSYLEQLGITGYSVTGSQFPSSAGGNAGCSFNFPGIGDPSFIEDGTNIIYGEIEAMSTTVGSCTGPNVVTVAGYDRAYFGTFRHAGEGSTNARFRVYRTARFN